MVSSQDIDPIIEDLAARQISMERELSALRETLEGAANGSVGAAVPRAEFREPRSAFAALREELRDQIGQFRAELRTEVGSLRGEIQHQTGQLQAEIVGLRSDLHRDSTERREQIAALTLQTQAESNALRADLRSEIGGLRGNLREEVAILKTQFAAIDQRIEVFFWRGMGGMLAIAIAVVTLVRLLW